MAKTEAFSRALIDAQLAEAGWKVIVHYNKSESAAAALVAELNATGFHAASDHESGEPLMRRAAAHFSLMESASKALGTGLKIGAGLGKKESLPKQSLGVLLSGPGQQPEIEFLLTPESRARCDELQSTRLEGHWAADDEYGVSLVLLWS